MNCIAILSVALSSVTNVYVLLIGTLVARAAELLFMVPFAKRKGFRFQTAFDLKDDNLHQMIHIAVPVIIGTSADQINVLVDRTLASEIAVGGISALNYASRLAGFVQGLFVLSISSVMYPMISKMASEHNMKGLKGSLSEAIGLIIGAVIFAEPIVTFLFGRGAFTSEAVIMTSAALRFYSLGMLAFGLREVLSRAFYALQDTRTPMVNGAIAVVINIVLNLILSRYLGIGGLALATSFSGLVATLLLFVTLREKIGGFGMKTVFSSFCKISVASLVMGVIARSLYHYVGATTTNKALILAIGTGAVAYFILVYLLRVPEVERTLVAVRQRVLRRKTRETGAE
jgi:putative peptidoglycan lipid II flippase